MQLTDHGFCVFPCLMVYLGKEKCLGLFGRTAYRCHGGAPEGNISLRLISDLTLLGSAPWTSRHCWETWKKSLHFSKH